jgi:S1-C subfamily serine protease
MPEGWTVIQTDATIHHGNSGGPGFDSNGNAIGIATFVGINPTGGELSGINFLLPINIAKQFANQILIQNTRGQLDDHWELALKYFWAYHYSAAIQEFNTVLSFYPGDPYVTQYINQANAQISNGNDAPVSNSTTMSSVMATAAVTMQVSALVPSRVPGQKSVVDEKNNKMC